MSRRELARLDALLGKLTAFDTLAALRAAAAAGYVPTVLPRNTRYGQLIRGLRAAGVRVFTGRTTR